MANKIVTIDTLSQKQHEYGVDFTRAKKNYMIVGHTFYLFAPLVHKPGSNAQTAARQQSNGNSEARMSGKCGEWRD